MVEFSSAPPLVDPEDNDLRTLAVMARKAHTASVTSRGKLNDHLERALGVADRRDRLASAQAASNSAPVRWAAGGLLVGGFGAAGAGIATLAPDQYKGLAQLAFIVAMNGIPQLVEAYNENYLGSTERIERLTRLESVARKSAQHRLSALTMGEIADLAEREMAELGITCARPAMDTPEGLAEYDDVLAENKALGVEPPYFVGDIRKQVEDFAGTTLAAAVLAVEAASCVDLAEVAGALDVDGQIHALPQTAFVDALIAGHKSTAGMSLTGGDIRSLQEWSDAAITEIGRHSIDDPSERFFVTRSLDRHAGNQLIEGPSEGFGVSS